MKLDIIYTFCFNHYQKRGAINRLRASIGSIINQNVRVCVCDASQNGIWDDIKDLGEIFYVHKPLNGEFCKGLIINYAVKQFVKNEYFLLSDIDLIYNPKFIETIHKYTTSVMPKRIVFHNYNLNTIGFSSDYKTHMKRINEKDPSRTYFGVAPGNGLIYTKSFYIVRGYDENMFGYGVEDAEFNLRIKYLNDYIEDKDPYLRTIHLKHKMNINLSDIQSKRAYLDYMKDLLSKKVGRYDFYQREVFNPNEYNRKLQYLKTNLRQNNWGVY